MSHYECAIPCKIWFSLLLLFAGSVFDSNPVGGNMTSMMGNMNISGNAGNNMTTGMSYTRQSWL